MKVETVTKLDSSLISWCFSTANEDFRWTCPGMHTAVTQPTVSLCSSDPAVLSVLHCVSGRTRVHSYEHGCDINS